MSRKQTLAAQKILVEQAIYQKQSAVWMRSLQRNDSDIAAVVDLNRSLQVVKNAFIKTYKNELLLLQVGQGKYRLSPNGSDCLVKPVLVKPQQPTSKPSSPIKGATGISVSASSPATPGKASAAIRVSPNHTVLQYNSISCDEIPVEQQELCVDFLLRKKLRRKLISRIIRRLQRIATSMDHLEQMTIPSSLNAMNSNTITDVVAPSGPPKYGDLRLYCDPNAVQEFAHLQQKQIQAWQHIINTREQDDYTYIDHDKVSAASPISSPKRHIVKNAINKPTSPNADDPQEETAVSEEMKDEDKGKEKSEAAQPIKYQGDSQDKTIDSQADKISETSKINQLEINSNDGANAPTVLTSSDIDTVQNTPPELPLSSTAAPEAVIPSTTDTKDASASGTVQDHSDPLVADYELFIDYKDAYEKTISSVIPTDDVTGVPDANNVVSFLQNLPPGMLNVNYTILQDQRDEDYVIIKNGIGATHPNMAIQEREAEYHKWESNLLSRIPEQPTYAELGYENRVFFFEDRLQRAIQKQNEQIDEERADKFSLEELGKDNEDKMDIDDENQPEKKEKETVTLKENDDEIQDEQDTDINSECVAAVESINEKVENKEEEDERAEEGRNSDEVEEKVGTKVEPKQLRPISLVAIPSFYEQDLKRIKLVQAELMASSMREHAIHRLEDVTREFNQCLNNSMELANQRTFLQNQVNQLSQQIRALSQSVQSDYMVQVSLAKNRWNLDRCSFETNKLNKMLPSRNGIMPTGSIMTQSYKARQDRIAVGLNEIVATCIADIVDCVDNIGNGRVRNDRFQDPFVLPTPSADVEALQRAKQLEATKRNDLTACTLKLRTSEGERLRAWRKMLKTKMEFDIPHQHYSSAGQVRLIRLDPNMCSTLQLPALHQTAAQDVPQELPGRSSVATYTPMHTARTQPSQVPQSESKYSTARVRERIASDGTVAPVTKPKMTADGLYLRPAGRTRKGMEWDAVRGIWIPASEAISQYSRDFLGYDAMKD